MMVFVGFLYLFGSKRMPKLNLREPTFFFLTHCGRPTRHSDCIIQLATPVSTRGSRPSGLLTTNCEEKRGEGRRVHFTNPHVNKTSVYKGSKILRAAWIQRVNIFFTMNTDEEPIANTADNKGKESKVVREANPGITGQDSRSRCYRL
ncbi:hypothetical protein AVEN_56871-1 [Araneus ventricosus]|uniref:Uncharacterized protein n=1 Tax=Araneus ventricosus TaxID=182803 RepID=A0A4Y2ER76_ARAVE|nr:hypothetical protein AVEN_56871-1 [Araneus ventricosus]